MLCEAGGLVFECVSMDEATFLYVEIFERRAYEQHGIALRCPCAAPGGLIVDAGANIGLFALACARTARQGVGPPPRVLAVEPIPSTFAVLCRNTADYADVTPVCAALGASNSLDGARFAHFRSCPGESTRHPAERAEMRRVLVAEAARAGVAHLRGDGDEDADLSEAEPLTVTQLTVSSLLRQHAPTPRGERPEPVHLLKVDVEGDELEVLRGVLPADWPCVRQVAVEVHNVGGRARQVAELLLGALGKGARVRVARDEGLAALGLDNCVVYAVAAGASAEGDGCGDGCGL